MQRTIKAIQNEIDSLEGAVDNNFEDQALAMDLADLYKELEEAKKRAKAQE